MARGRVGFDLEGGMLYAELLAQHVARRRDLRRHRLDFLVMAERHAHLLRTALHQFESVDKVGEEVLSPENSDEKVSKDSKE